MTLYSLGVQLPISRFWFLLSLYGSLSGCAGSASESIPTAQERVDPRDAVNPDYARAEDAGPDDAGPEDGGLADLELADLGLVDGGDTALSDASEPDPEPGGCPPTMTLILAGDFAFGPGPLSTPIDADYCVDLFEVTAGEFNGCVTAGACEGYQEWSMCQELELEFSPNQCFEDRGEFAANYIDWYRANAYCEWAGKRLPTSQEWERAARGDVGFTYPWGEDPLDCDRAHQGRGQIFDSCLDYGDLPNRPVEVGSYVAGVSPFGLFDALGNVKEWVDIREDTSALPQDGDKALSRGGAYNEGDWLMTTLAYDGQLGPQITSQGHGFRCVSEPLGAGSD